MSDITENKGITKPYIRLCIITIAILLLIMSAVEFVMLKNSSNDIDLYKIEINRVQQELIHHKNEETFAPDLSQFKTIKGIVPSTANDSSDFYTSDYHYCIIDVNGTLYRIDYEVNMHNERKSIYFLVNIIMGILFLVVIIIMIYIYNSIIKQFNRISGYPYELAKGNLTIPLKESRNQYFGRFLWGLDMLRENLENERQKNLDLNKEKNVFLLSLSHDTKTPISAIKLYAAAIKKNLYTDKERLGEVADKIDDKANEIDGYISKIISASNDDFLNFEVHNRELYLSELVNNIKNYYNDKLESIGTNFTIEKYSDHLITGDPERLTEVLQNIFENAIKYGDNNQITMKFATEEDATLITVTNSGCSLKEDQVEHIFESFYRGSNVGAKAGSGLGLYICKKLMQMMGGEVFALTENGYMSVTVVINNS